MAKTLNSESTKEEELKALEAFAAKCESGSYLHQLFTSKFLAWVSEQIKNDFMPDLMNYTDSAIKEARDWHQNQVDTERRYSDKVNALEATRLEAERRLKYCQENADRQAKELDDFGIAYSHSLTENSELKSEVKRLEDDIVNLKAKLYDLTAEDLKEAARHTIEDAEDTDKEHRLGYAKVNWKSINELKRAL